MNSPQQGAPPNSSFSTQNAMQAHPVAMLPDASIARQTAHTRDGSESLNHSLSFFDVNAQQHPQQQQLVQYVVQQPMPISASPPPFSNTDSPQHIIVLPSAMPQQNPQQYNVPHGAQPIPMQPMFFVPTPQQQQLLPVPPQPGNVLPPGPGANQPQFIFLSQPITTSQHQQQPHQQQQQQPPPSVSGGYVLRSPQSAAPSEHPALDRQPPTANVVASTPVALPPFPTATTEAASHKQPGPTANLNSQSQTNASSPQNQACTKPGDNDDDDEAPSPLATKYIFNCLDKRINAEFLSTALKPYNVERVHVVGERTGKIRGFAYVDFPTPEDALRCHREMNNSKLLDRHIKIHVSKHDPSFGKE